MNFWSRIFPNIYKSRINNETSEAIVAGLSQIKATSKLLVFLHTGEYEPSNASGESWKELHVRALDLLNSALIYSYIGVLALVEKKNSVHNISFSAVVDNEFYANAFQKKKMTMNWFVVLLLCVHAVKMMYIC